jgi:hypothetical protein
LKGISTDEGKNLLRLFKQVLNDDLVEKFGQVEGNTIPSDPVDPAIPTINGLFEDFCDESLESVDGFQQEEAQIQLAKVTAFSLNMEELEEDVEQ